MEQYREIVRMNEAPTRPLHLHKVVRPVLNEDGELDFVGVEDPRKNVRNIRGTPASAILNLGLRPEVSDQIELALIHMIAEYRRTWWGDEDRKDAARRLEAQQEQENEDTQSRQRKREAQAEWDFLYGDETEGYEI